MSYNDPAYQERERQAAIVRQEQNNSYPRCVNHTGRPAPFRAVVDEVEEPVCEECGIAWYHAQRLFVRSQSLVSGGVEGL